MLEVLGASRNSDMSADRTQSQDVISSSLNQAAEDSSFEDVPLDDEDDILPDEGSDWDLLCDELDTLLDEDGDLSDWELLEGADVEDDWYFVGLLSA